MSLLILLLIGTYAAANEQPIPYPYPKPRRVMIHSDRMARCFAGAIAQVGDPRTLGPSSLYLNNFRTKDSFHTHYCVFSSAKFLDYLSIQPFRPCDYETGRESRLRDWILKQAENSVTPLSIFRKSLTLNDGHVFDALLTIHQLLRNEARWSSKRYYYYDSDEKKAGAFWAKFVDIRGDLKEKGEEGDHRGSWYRIWGSMIYRLSLTEELAELDPTNDCLPKSAGTMANTWADFSASIVSLAAELMKYIPDDYKPGGDRSGKARINSAGSQIASYLISAVQQGNELDPDGKDCTEGKLLLNSSL